MHDIGDLMCHVFPDFSVILSAVIIMSHVRHLSSLHLVTSGFGRFSENAAFVSIRLRFCGSRRLTISFVLFSNCFILVEFDKNFRCSLTALITGGLFGLCVITIERTLLSFLFRFVDRNSSIVSSLAF